MTNYVNKKPVQYRVISREQCEEIVNATLRVLEKTGCVIQNEEAIQLMKDAGCFVKGDHVRIPSSVVKKSIADAPSQLILYDRMGNPAMRLGSNKYYFGPAVTNTYIIDIKTGAKRGVIKSDVVNACKVCEALPNINWSSGLGLVSDCDSRLSDLYETRAMLPNTTKPLLTWATNVENLKDSVAMCSVVAGDMKTLAEKPFVVYISVSSGFLQHSDNNIAQILYLAENRIPFQYISGVTLGGSGPVTIAGTNVAGLADTLVGLVITQLKNPGAPFIAVKATNNQDMRTLALSHSRPEFAVAQAATADIFRYLDLPFAVNLGESDSPIFDQQAAFDITAQLYTGALSRSDMIVFIGYLESGNTGSLEALVFGDEIIGFFRRLVDGFEISAETLAEDVMHNVGPGGHFIGEEHTFENFKNLWQPSHLVTQSREKWEQEGKKDLGNRLNERVREIISRENKNPLNESVLARLDEILNRAEERINQT